MCAVEITDSNKYSRLNEVVNAYKSCNTMFLYSDDSLVELNLFIDDNNNAVARAKIKHLYFMRNFNTSNVTDMGGMFYGCSGLTTLEVSNFDTSNVTNISNMFYHCSSLTTLDVSNWDTSKVIYIHNMFNGCKSLTTLDVSNFDTSKVTQMNDMFHGCSSLTTLDVSEWDTSKVDTMVNMFLGCSILETLDVSEWDTSMVTNMCSMFQACSSLTTLDVSKWKTSSVNNISYMFCECSSLTTLDVSNWNTSKVTTFEKTFINCKSLTSLNVSNWDLSSATTIRWMFDGCTELVDLDISNWDTSNVTIYGGNGGGAFSNCPKLKSDKFPVFDFSKAKVFTRFIANSYSITELHFKNFGPNATMFNDGYRGGKFIDLDNNGSLTTVTGLNLTYMANNDASHLNYGIIYSPTLVNLTLEGTINNSFKIEANALSHDSLMNIINALATLSKNQNKTANIGSTNLAKLTNTEIKIATDKGWTLV